MADNHQQQQQQQQQQAYQKKVQKISPKPTILKNIIWAFVIGGLICVLGQFIQSSLLEAGMSKKDAAGPTAVILIFLAALLTGLGVYDDLGKHAGAGSVVPITGFANSVVAPAMEFKREGFVFGVGAKMFIIAGPVIVYGTLTAIIIGFIYWLRL
ncbi:MAG: stage V sporulation protein AC [Sporomusaceae bacterium]|nr:stage V sporulation protein AC [Sporomusaceae bacterium]